MLFIILSYVSYTSFYLIWGITPSANQPCLQRPIIKLWHTNQSIPSTHYWYICLCVHRIYMLINFL